MKWNPDDKYHDAELEALQQRLRRPALERQLVKTVYHNVRKDACMFVYTFFAGMLFPYTFTYTSACVVFVLLAIAMVYTYRDI